MGNQKIALQAHNLIKSYPGVAPVSILRGVNLEILQGETVAIMGRSGEGKSTLLNILGTLETACSGSLIISGHGVTAANQAEIRNKHIGFVFQSFHLLEDFSVIENVLMPGRIGRKATDPKSEIYQRAHALLERMGLGQRLHFLTKLLSGGERQRVGIARALCNNPDLILADEPSGNLDRQTAQGIHELLMDFAHEQKKTLVVVTHNEELAALCDRRFFLRDGLLY